MEQMGQYKGIFYNNKATHHFYEGGAHFSYFALVKVLEELKQKLDKGNEKGSTSTANEIMRLIQDEFESKRYISVQFKDKQVNILTKKILLHKII